MQLFSYREVPPGGYYYTVPQTGHKVHSWDMRTWVQETIKHLEGNGLAVPLDLAAQMEDQLCQTLPPGWCQYDDPVRPRVNIEYSWSDVERGSKTFLDWVSQGRPLVTQDEAERRAAICRTCYLNVNAQGCGPSCRELIRKLAGLFVNRKTSQDDHLRTCAACKCHLKSKVHFTLDIIEAHDTDTIQMLLPGFCWLKKGGDNYDPNQV